MLVSLTRAPPPLCYIVPCIRRGSMTNIISTSFRRALAPALPLHRRRRCLSSSPTFFFLFIFLLVLLLLLLLLLVVLLFLLLLILFLIL